MNPTVLPFLNLYPLPNGRDFGNGSGQFLSSPTVVTNEDNVMGRVDHQLNAKTGIFGRYTFDQDSVISPLSLPRRRIPRSTRRQDITLQSNSVPSPDAVITSVSPLIARGARLCSVTATASPRIGLCSRTATGRIQLGVTGASVRFTALTTIGGTQGTGPNAVAFNILQWGDDLSYVHGKHSFKFGANIERLQDNYKTNGELWGSYTFTNLTTFLAGTPANFQVASPVGLSNELGMRQTLMGFYAQDDYKVNSRLTLNLGLRWEAPTDPSEAKGRTSILPSLSAASLVVTGVETHIAKKNFEPRVGLAWQITNDGKTVLRAGAGIYQNQILPWAYDNLTRNPPFSGLFSATNPPFPNGVNVFSGLTPGTSTGLVALAVLDPNIQTPTNYQYNLSIQRQITKNTVVEVAYAGDHADHLITELEADTPIPTICSTALSNCPAGVANGAFYFPAGSKRRNTAWNGIRFYQTNGESEYDSATVTLRHQSSNGFSGQVYYTFSKALDDSSGVSTGESQRSPQSPMNPDLPLRDNWGLADFNSKHTLVGYASYPLPFHVGSRALGTLVNSWKIDGIVTLTSGQPLTPILSASNSRNLSTAGLAERPNLNAGFSNNPTSGVAACLTGSPEVGTARNWYNPCAFSLPITGTYGDAGRNTIIGPGLADVDMAVEKMFILG